MPLMYYCGTLHIILTGRKNLLGELLNLQLQRQVFQEAMLQRSIFLVVHINEKTFVFLGQFYNQKGTVHFNINSTSTNQKLNLQLTGNYMLDNNHSPNADLTAVAIGLEPNAPNLYNSDGTLNC